jgi:RND family efflux transporter MFP subunit
MKANRFFIFAMLLLATTILAACGKGTPQAVPTVVLEGSSATGKPAAVDSEKTVSASGEIVPVQKVSMSFAQTGIVKTVEVKEGQDVKAGDVLATLDTVILEARVVEAQASADRAETQVRYLRRVGTADEQLSAAVADVDRANAVVDQMKAMLAQATLNAPIDGAVASVELFPGETATPGKVVVILGDLDHMQVETTDLSERDVAVVQPGQPATIYIEALASQLQGTVLDVARVSETVGGDVVYKVTIGINEQPEGLRWGMSADVTIQAGG